MTDNNKKLLDEVITKRLEEAKASEAGTEKGDVAFKQAMDAIDRRNEVDNQSASKKNAWIGHVIRGVEVLAAILVVPAVQHCYNMKYAKTLCNFEKDYTFTTTAGKATKSFFNFKGKN